MEWLKRFIQTLKLAKTKKEEDRGTDILRGSNDDTKNITEQFTILEKKYALPTHNEKGQIIIRSLDKYRELLEEGQKDFDFSELDTCGENIQQLDLSNKGLNINLQEIFHPIFGSIKYFNNILQPIGHHGDDFVFLDKANLKGNNVTGELCNFKTGKTVCTFIYSEKTFDYKYMLEHPQYFLSFCAPTELKEKFYNPLVKTEIVQELFNSEKSNEKEVYYRQELTFDEYLKYYKSLNGKYLDRFKISEKDYGKIKLIEALGLENARVVLNMALNSKLDVNLLCSVFFKLSLEEIRGSFSNENKQQTIELLEQIDNAIEISGNPLIKKRK
ncbi:MAG TPA: hypothetical protein PKY25_01600 [Bacilli bacterium]|nr:hypothetical protein [Bacilli bacterium]